MLEIKNISFSYKLGDSRELEVLQNTSLTLNKGEIVSLTGPSGCGKSTIGKVAAGLLKPSKGCVIVDGTPIQWKGGWHGVGYVFQNPEDQFFMQDVYREIMCGPLNISYSFKEADEITVFVLKKLFIEDIKDKKIKILSGGEKQKVAIGAMLAMKPKYLILDEPTSMIGMQDTSELISCLTALKKKWAIGILIIGQVQYFNKQVDRYLSIDNKGKLWEARKSSLSR